MVRFQGLTAAALGVMLSAQAQGSTGDQHLAPPPTLLEADSLVPRGPEPVMDRVVANEFPNANRGMWPTPHPPASSAELTKVYLYIQGDRTAAEYLLGINFTSCKNWCYNLPRCTIPF